uniref:Uncharacterized protein n=1 Tax=Arundo donax TaxID=35708 RepID=A0A0A8ZCJ8_ARUDO
MLSDSYGIAQFSLSNSNKIRVPSVIN